MKMLILGITAIFTLSSCILPSASNVTIKGEVLYAPDKPARNVKVSYTEMFAVPLPLMMPGVWSTGEHITDKDGKFEFFFESIRGFTDIVARPLYDCSDDESTQEAKLKEVDPAPYIYAKNLNSDEIVNLTFWVCKPK